MVVSVTYYVTLITFDTSSFVVEQQVLREKTRPIISFRCFDLYVEASKK